MASWMIRCITMRFIMARSEARSEARNGARNSARHGLLGRAPSTQPPHWRGH